MKQFKKILFICGSLMLFIVTGCEDRVLNQSPSKSFIEDDLWNDIGLVKSYVWNNYNALGGWGVDQPSGQMGLPASLSDDSYILFDYGLWLTNTGNISPDNMGAWASMWEDNYKYIRNVNIFFNKIDEVEADASVKKRLKGEMKFIRAWSYAKLTNFFGGVPLITEPFELNDDFGVKRESYQASIVWIIKELNEAVEMVPNNVPADEWGRVTKGAVRALKSRVLLYAASKLHDPGTEPSGPLYDYDKGNKWEEAAAAAKDVIDMAQYSLVEVGDWKDYQDMFLHNTSEIIFAKPYSSQYRQNGANIGLVNSPNGYNGWSGNVPTQDLVNAFQMKDGKSIEESALYDPSANTIYEDRELRFYADIVHQGAHYRGREAEFYEPGGLDSPDGPQAWNASRTGYTMRKHMDESVEFTSTNPTTPQIYFRLAEIYLNYAEAQYHLGNESVARAYVNKIRKRVKLPEIASTGAELLEDIQHERRIELVYEGYHRFNDLRRWMLAEKELSENAKGISWQKVNEQGEPTTGGKLAYEIVTAQQRSFKKRMYYLPIPRSEVNKTDLKQNWNYN